MICNLFLTLLSVQRKSVAEDDEELDSNHEEEEDLDVSSSGTTDSNDGGDSESSPSVSGRRTRKRKTFVIPPPRSLPQRTTRGKRMGGLAIPDDDDADEEFWNQDFFAEEERDDRYETESEPEDRFDDDFMDSEEEEDDEGEEEEARASAMEPKKKVLKPPGYKKKAASVAPKQTAKTVKQEQQVPLIPERTMSVRNSTRQKVEEAEEQRKFQEEIKPKKVTKAVVHRQLTQAELLAEAARTEVENIRSLQYMEAIEEENKRKASSTGGRYSGPMISIKSVKNADGFEQTAVIVKNMNMPEYLQPQKAPPVPEKDMCAVTNTVAKYRDPLTGKPYATMEAFKILRGMQKS